MQILAYFGSSYFLAILIMWGAFAWTFGAALLWVVRRTMDRAALWYEWGVFGALVGAFLFPLLFK
jgi:hypothetical protein